MGPICFGEEDAADGDGVIEGDGLDQRAGAVDLGYVGVETIQDDQEVQVGLGLLVSSWAYLWALFLPAQLELIEHSIRPGERWKEIGGGRKSLIGCGGGLKESFEVAEVIADADVALPEGSAGDQFGPV